MASASDSDQAVSKIGLTTSNEAKQAARTSKIDDQDEVAVSGDGHNKLDHNKTPIKTKFESVEPRLIVPPAPRKRRNRGKKIDLSAASESDTSPTPLARKRKLVDINDKEDDQNTAQGIDSFIELSGEKSTSVPRWLLKSESKKRLNQPDSSSASVIKELPHFLQTGTKKAPTRSPSKPTATARSHSARRSNTKSVVRNGPTSPFVPLPELKLYRPGLSTSGTAQRKAPKSLLNDETIPNIMPSIEHDDVNWLGSREAGKGGSSAPDAESDMNDDGESESQDLLGRASFSSFFSLQAIPQVASYHFPSEHASLV